MKYEKWSLGYWTLKQYVRFIDWLINNKIIMLNTQNIPKDKPILIVPNHQNALSDPLSILLHTNLQPVWLARADIFKNKMVASILRFLKIMPVYRMRDGKDNLGKNDITFANSVKVLQRNGALALFPEGAHTGKRQMIAHKKAVPRIVFMAEEMTNQSLDIQIIPTGIYYSSYWKFNRNLIVDFGTPIAASEFSEEFKENPNAAALNMRKQIYDGIDERIINIKSKDHYYDFENIIEVYGKHFLSLGNQKYSVANLYLSNRDLSKKLDKLENSKPEDIQKIIGEVNNFRALLKKHKLRNWLIEKPKNNLFRIGLNKIVLFLGLPIFLFGFFLNGIPFFAIDIFTRKKIKEIAFWSSFALVLGMFAFPLFYLIEFFALDWLVPTLWLKLLLFAFIPFAGKLAFKWYILFRKTVGRARLFILRTFNKKEYNKLLSTQQTLFETLDRMIK